MVYGHIEEFEVHINTYIIIWLMDGFSQSQSLCMLGILGLVLVVGSQYPMFRGKCDY